MTLSNKSEKQKYWWRKVISPRPKQRSEAVQEGIPLAGTGVADPVKIRSTLNFLTNDGRASGKYYGNCFDC